MPRVPPEVKAAFPLEAVIKIRALQIDLEKFFCNKIRNLAIKAKEANQIQLSKLYYRAWGARMGNLKRLQKQEREEQKVVVKETKKLGVTKKTKINPNANSSFVNSSNNVNLLRQVC